MTKGYVTCTIFPKIKITQNLHQIACKIQYVLCDRSRTFHQDFHTHLLFIFSN